MEIDIIVEIHELDDEIEPFSRGCRFSFWQNVFFAENWSKSTDKKAAAGITILHNRFTDYDAFARFQVNFECHNKFFHKSSFVWLTKKSQSRKQRDWPSLDNGIHYQR